MRGSGAGRTALPDRSPGGRRSRKGRRLPFFGFSNAEWSLRMGLERTELKPAGIEIETGFESPRNPPMS